MSTLINEGDDESRKLSLMKKSDEDNFEDLRKYKVGSLKS